MTFSSLLWRTASGRSHRSRILGAPLALLLAAGSAAQVIYSQNWNGGTVAGWTGNFAVFSGATACGGSGGAMRRNLYVGATTGQLISPLTGSSLGNPTQIDYGYKVMNWSANTMATPTPWGWFDVQYGSSPTGPWTTIATISDETQTSGVCLARSHTFTPPPGPLYVRFAATRTAGDYYLNFDDVVIVEANAPCVGVPAPGNVTGPSVACGGGVAVLGLQNLTLGTGVSYQWFESAVSAAGPWLPLGTAATQAVSPIATTWYYCAVTCASGPHTGNSSVKQVDIVLWPQGWESGVITANCWSNTGGTELPSIAAASAFGVGTSSARFNFYYWTSPNSAILTSPTFPPTSPGDRAFFDVAGTQYGGDLSLVDLIALEESSDGGATWNTVVVMNNALGGLLRTAPPQTTWFVPTASQWESLDFELTPGTNRIRFHATSGYGNDVYIDNVAVGPPQPGAVKAEVRAYGEIGEDSLGNAIRLESSDLILGSSATLSWTRGPVPTAGILALGMGTGGWPFDNVLVQIDLPVDVTLAVTDGIDPVTTCTVAVPNHAQLLGAVVNWQAFPLDLALTSLPIAWSNGLETKLGNQGSLATVGMDVEYDEDDQDFVPCPGGQKRFKVTGWRRQEKPLGVQSVWVTYGGNLITSGTVAPGCLRGKLYTATVRVCLPVPLAMQAWGLTYKDCEQPLANLAVPGAATVFTGIAPVVVMPAGGVLQAPPGTWLNQRWSSSRRSVLLVTPLGAWATVAPGRALVTFEGTLVTPNGRVEVRISYWVKVEPPAN